MPSPCLRRLFFVLLLITVTVLPALGANIAAGSITVRTVPGGASVTLDGVYQGQTPLGNDALLIENIDPGPHQLVLSKSGYLDDHHPFWIGSGQRSDIRITLSATTSQSGSVSIVSSPAGADVLLDGGYRGRTPITISGLTTGRHTVVLELPGYVRYEDAVEIQNGVMTYLDPVLTSTAAVGFISVVSSPAGAFVYIDGAYRGATPLTVAAPTGSRRIELDRPGYADWSSTAQVTSGATVQVNAYLQPLPASSSGGIAVSSDPAGAAVYLDDQVQGSHDGLRGPRADRGGRREPYALAPARRVRRVPPDGPGNAGLDREGAAPALGHGRPERDRDTDGPRGPRSDPGELDTVRREGGGRRSGQGHRPAPDPGCPCRPAHGSVLPRRLRRTRAAG